MGDIRPINGSYKTYFILKNEAYFQSYQIGIVENEDEKSVNNGKLCLQPPQWVAHASRLDQNNGQLRFHTPPRVAHASRLDQNPWIIIVSESLWK